MRVKFLALDAGPNGVRQIGSVHEIDDAEAKALMKGGYAEKFTGDKKAPSRTPKADAENPPPASDAEPTDDTKTGEPDPT